MTQDEIRAIAMEVAKELLDEPLNIGQAEHYTDFATHFLAAITEKAEPDGYIVQEESQDGVDYTYSASYPEAVHEHINETIQLCVDNDIPAPVMHCRPFFLHPAIEPAGEVVVTTTEEGRCVCVTRQDEEGRILKVLWEAPAIEPAPQQASRDLQHEHTMNQFKEVCHGRNCTANKAQPTHSAECKADHDNAVCAPPLPDEVAQIVEELRTDNCQCLDAYKRRGRIDPQCQSCDTKDERNRAADMIERLARERDMWRETDLRDSARVDELAEKLGRLARQVPQEAIALAKDMVDGHYPNHREYIVANALLIAAGEVK